MKKTITVKRESHVLEINIETENNYFSITGDYFEPTRKRNMDNNPDLKRIDGKMYELTMCGCIHDEILKHRPDLQLLVDLHLSDLQGKPMYYIDNGFYFYEISRGIAKHHTIKEGDKEKYEKVLREHLRISETELIDLLSELDSQTDKRVPSSHIFMRYIDSKLLERWAKQAEQAIQLINQL